MTPEDVLREFVHNIESVYGWLPDGKTRSTYQIRQALAKEWYDLAVTYSKAKAVLQKVKPE